MFASLEQRLHAFMMKVQTLSIVLLLWPYFSHCIIIFFDRMDVASNLESLGLQKKFRITWQSNNLRKFIFLDIGWWCWWIPLPSCWWCTTCLPSSSSSSRGIANRQRVHDRRTQSQFSIHAEWNLCLYGISLASLPTSNYSKQIVQSWDSSAVTVTLCMDFHQVVMVVRWRERALVVVLITSFVRGELKDLYNLMV